MRRLKKRFKRKIRRLLLTPQLNRGMKILLSPLRRHLPKWLWLRLPIVGTFEVSVSPNSLVQYHSFGEYVGRVLYWQSIWTYESDAALVLASLAQHARVFLDIGAHTGLYTLLIKGINPEVSVYAFEPVPSVYQHLKLNMALNNFIKTVMIEQAVVASSYAERVPFFISPTQLATSSLKSEFTKDRDQAETIFVKSYCLDDYVKLNKIQKVDLIKIDVEGAEAEVLTGSQEVLRHHRPIVLCEILPKNRQAFPKIEAILQTVQYEYMLITPGGLITQKSFSDNSFRQRGHNFLLYPVEKREMLQRSGIRIKGNNDEA